MDQRLRSDGVSTWTKLGGRIYQLALSCYVQKYVSSHCNVLLLFTCEVQCL